MNNCPSNSNPRNCAFESAQWLVNNELIVIDNIGMREPGKRELIIDQQGAFTLETFSVVNQYEKAFGWDFVTLGCIMCGKLVTIEDDCGDLSVSFNNNEIE